MSPGHDAPSDRDELVRCTSCRAVYAHPVGTADASEVACPECGSPSWIAAAIPLATTPLPELGNA